MSANPQPRPLVTGDLDLLISRSLDGDLPGEEERELQAVLTADPAARARYDAMARLVGRLEELPDPETPFALATRVSSQAEADTKGLTASLQRYGFYFRPATMGVVAAGLLTVALVYTIRNPAKPVATVAEAEAPPAPAAVDDGRVTVFFGASEKAKGEIAAPAAAPAGTGAVAANEARSNEARKRADLSEPVLVASAETKLSKDEGGFAPERDAAGLEQDPPAAPAPAERPSAGKAEATRQEAESAAGPTRLRAAASAATGAARPGPCVDLVGKAAAGLRLVAPARLDGLEGPFDGNYRLELNAAGRVTDVVRLFGGSGTEPSGLPDRLRALSFGSANGAPVSGAVDVRVRLP